VIDVANLQFILYLAFADASYSFVYREVNAISCLENGATILKRKSGEEFAILSFGDHGYVEIFVGYLLVCDNDYVTSFDIRTTIFV
jgi:hypothetical protein